MKKDYFISPKNFFDDNDVYIYDDFLTFNKTESHNNRFRSKNSNIKTDENRSNLKKTEEN